MRVRAMALAVCCALAGCGPLVRMEAPSADGPRISNLELVANRVTANCPVALHFRFDAPNAGVVRVMAGWVRVQRRTRTSGYSELPIDVDVGKSTSGDIVVHVRPERSGTYLYHVQVQDRAGRWSNVLDEGLSVEERPAAGAQDCS